MKPFDAVEVGRHQITLNAKFHANNLGIMVRNATGPFDGQLPINLTAALGATAKGWQVINIQGKVLDPLTGATNTGARRAGRAMLQGGKHPSSRMRHATRRSPSSLCIAALF